MLGNLLAFAFPVGAASNGQTPIEFQQGDKMVKVLSLDAIRAITPPVSLKIFEPHENRERIYQALPARPVLDHVFGKEWEQAREIVFTSIDGFQPSIPVEKFLAHPAYLAPSVALRKWFGHEAARWEEFCARYEAEVSQHPEELKQLRALARKGPVTLVYSAHDELHNNAVALRRIILR